MATGIFFSGSLTHVPGSYVTVDVSALQRVGLGATGVVAVLGEAVGGQPFSDSSKIHSITNPAKVPSTFRSGDLFDAGPFLFDPSKDPDIPGGAQQVRFVKVNPATQSAVTLPGAVGDAAVLTSEDYGLFTRQINIDVADGTNQGKSITIVFETTTEAFDDVGGDNIFTALYTPGAGGATTMTLAVDPAVGVTAAYTRTQAGLDSAYDGQITSIAGRDNEKLATITAGQAVRVVSSDNADTMIATVYGIDNGTGNPASEQITLTGTAPNAGTTVWAEVHGFILASAPAGNVTLEENFGAFSDLYVIAAGNPVVGGGCQVFNQLENAGSVLTLVADGATTDDLIVIGTDTADVAQLEEVTLTGAVGVASSGSWNRVDVLALGYVPAARSLTLSGLLLNAGDTVSVTGQPGDTETVTVYGLDNGGAAQSEQIVLNGATPVAGTATWSKVLGVALSGATGGTVTVTASSESVTVISFDGSAAQVAGVSVVGNIEPEGGTIDVVSSAAADGQDILVIGTTTAGSAQIEKLTLNGTTTVNGAATWGSITGLAVAHVPVASTLTFDGTIAAPVGAYDTVQKVVDLFNANGGWTLTTVTPSPSTFNISDMDNTPAASVLTVAGFLADLKAFIDKINDASALMTAARAPGATGAPSNTASPVFLESGVEGTTLFSHWQAALDGLRSEDVNTVCVLTADAAVHAAVVSHCVYMARGGKNDRDSVVGEATGTTLAQAKAAALALNTRHTSLCVQTVDRFNENGVTETFPPYFTALLAAGMESGVAPGVPITQRFINCLDFGQDSSFNPQDDGDGLIQAGVMLMEKVPNRGIRWLRAVTTHLIDDNLAYVERSTNKAVNFAIREFRRRMEIIAGRPGFAGTVNAAKAAALQVLGELVELGTITSWRALTLELAADVLDVDVEIAPVVPVNFVRTTLHLVPASLSAAA